MLKKVLAGTSVAAVLIAGFLLGSLTLGPAFAQTPHNNPPAQAAVQSTGNDDAAEAAVKGPDTDAVEEQVGYQDELDDDAAEATVEDADMDAVEEQQPQYTGSIQLDDTQYEGMSEAEEAAALQGKATVSAADAEAAAIAANPGATVVKTELDNENGVLVYSVELSNGNDVKVDAGNGQILHTEAGELEGQDTDED